MIFPLIVTAVGVGFATVLFMQFRERRRPHQLVWAISLCMGALAGLAFALFLATDRNVWFFRIYYALGALLMAGYLGLGEVYLLANRKHADWTAQIVVALSIAGLVFLFAAPVNTSALHASDVEAGTRAVSGAVVIFIAILNTFGAGAVLGGAGLSAWRVYRRSGPVRFLAANVLIALGTILASLAGAMARVTNTGSAFWVLLATGFLVLFAGFLFTVPRARPA